MRNMQDDIKVLKTMVKAIINGQSAMKGEIIDTLGKRIKKVEDKLDEHRIETKKGFVEVNDRIDKLGHELFVLNEDAPTGKDFKKLEKRVTKLENKYFATA